MTNTDAQRLHNINLTLSDEECTMILGGLLKEYHNYRENYKRCNDATVKQYWLNMSVRAWMLYVEIVHTMSESGALAVPLNPANVNTERGEN